MSTSTLHIAFNDYEQDLLATVQPGDRIRITISALVHDVIQTKVDASSYTEPNLILDGERIIQLVGTEASWA